MIFIDAFRTQMWVEPLGWTLLVRSDLQTAALRSRPGGGCVSMEFSFGHRRDLRSVARSLGLSVVPVLIRVVHRELRSRRDGESGRGDRASRWPDHDHQSVISVAKCGGRPAVGRARLDHRSPRQSTGSPVHGWLSVVWSDPPLNRQT